MKNTGVGAAQTTGAGGSSSVSRQTFVGLNHNKLGTVALGRQYAPGYFGVRMTPLAVTPSRCWRLNGAGRNNTISSGHRAAPRQLDLPSTSPNWSGFTVAGIYPLAKRRIDLTRHRPKTTSTHGCWLNYANGPLNIDHWQYQTRQGVSTAIATSRSSRSTQDSINEVRFGGSYDFKVVKLYARPTKTRTTTTVPRRPNSATRSGRWAPRCRSSANGKIHAGYSRPSWDSKNSGNSTVWSLVNPACPVEAHDPLHRLQPASTTTAMPRCCRCCWQHPDSGAGEQYVRCWC